jgi:hypothetical protein
MERRKSIRTPLIRNKLVEGEAVRFYGIGLRSPARPCLSTSEAEARAAAPPQLVNARLDEDGTSPGRLLSVDANRGGGIQVPGAPVLCSVWTTTKTSTFINNF